MCINKTLSNAAAHFIVFIVYFRYVKRGPLMRHFRKQLFSSGKVSELFRSFPVILFFCALLPALCLSPGTAAGAMDLSDEPMMAQIKAAPANIMIVLDDSGSMTFEILIAGQVDGRYPSPLDTTSDKREGFCYIFDYLGDNAYAWDDADARDENDNLRYMLAEYRTFWKSQFYGENVMYYDPGSTYEPWPDYPGQTFSNANMEFPKPHPLKTGTTTLDLDAESFTVVREGGPNLIVKHAHYFVEDEDTPKNVWLVVIDGESSAIEYYKVTDIDGTGLNEKVVKVREAAPPSEIITGRTYSEERQNFANWFTYARRREYVAKSAIARVINSLQGVRVGILGINGKIIVPLKPLGVWKDGVYSDQRDDLLADLYAYDSRGGTPLREGLNAVGKYYKDNLLDLRGKAGDERPYYSEADGGACQQSFTIIMTDGYYSTASSSGVGNADGDHNTDWDGESPGPYTDLLSETLADVAMYYYENDLRTALPDHLNDPERLNPSAIDTAQHQHMVTFGVAFGVTGNLEPNAYNDDPASPDFMKCVNSANCTVGQYPDWPSSISIRSKQTVDDLYHATVNGRGNFLTAKDPGELADSLLAVMNSILDRLGSAAAVSINGDSLYSKVSADVLMFQASYKTNDWSGDVKAYGVDTFSGRVLVEGPPKWSAADSLSATAWESRNILSYNGSEGIDFDPTATATWSTILGADFENIINYVRGQNDIPGFRVRNKLLGDIVHSSPVFKDNFVYVGANDGMLHAFQITSAAGTVSGQEKFAYVPSFVHENLVNLTEPAMAHKFFVDLTPTVVNGEGLLGGTGDKTILVGGLGKGGKGYFALDITYPTTMGTDQVLWEFPNDDTSSEVPDMGYSFSKPLVVQTNSAISSEAWVVIASNGYDSVNGEAVLYLLRPATGEVIKKLSATVSDTDNGLSSPIAVDVNYDRKVDFVYAGDLKGNMWKFDLTGDQASKWSVAYHDGTNNQPLFQAKNLFGDLQPITTKPEVMFHPEKHGLMVLFGTGKFLGASDFTDNRVQTVYGIWDYGDRALWPGPWGLYSMDDDQEYLGAFDRPDLSNPDLEDQNVTLLEQTATTYPDIEVELASGETVLFDIRVMSGDQPNWHTAPDGVTNPPSLPDLAEETADIAGHGGWYWDLPLTGERVVSDVLLRDGRLIVIPFTPDPDRCSDGGSSFLMELNSFTGGTSGGAVFDINNDGKIDGGDLVTTHTEGEGGEIQEFSDGLKLAGNVQPPAILILNGKIEVKYLSSSTGAVHMVREKAVRLGVTYWKELDR